VTVPLDLKPLPVPIEPNTMLRIVNDNQKRLMEQWRAMQALIDSLQKRIEYLETTIARQ
jgi:hypothetical protein